MHGVPQFVALKAAVLPASSGPVGTVAHANRVREDRSTIGDEDRPAVSVGCQTDGIKAARVGAGPAKRRSVAGGFPSAGRAP
jgi:hypothetical protein